MYKLISKLSFLRIFASVLIVFSLVENHWVFGAGRSVTVHCRAGTHPAGPGGATSGCIPDAKPNKPPAGGKPQGDRQATTGGGQQTGGGTHSKKESSPPAIDIQSEEEVTPPKTASTESNQPDTAASQAPPAPEEKKLDVEKKDKSPTQMKTCNGKDGTDFKFPNFTPAEKELNQAYNAYATECDRESLDSKVTAASALEAGSSGSDTAESTVGLAQSGSDIGAAFDGMCEGLQDTYEKAFEKAEKALNTDKALCMALATTEGNPPPGSANCIWAEAANQKICNKSIENKIGKLDTIRNWVGNHKLLMAGLLSALGAGTYALMKSGDKQKDDFRTSKAPIPTDTPKPSPTATPSDTPAPHPTEVAQAPNNFCGASLQPLECFVTPGCDLKCVADKYGVPNYGGMTNDNTRIDPQGRPVDGSTAATNSGVGSGSSSGSGSGSGGGNVADLNATSEAGTVGDGSLTRASTDYGYGDDGGYGGGGSFGGDSGRDPANDSRYANQGKFGADGGKNRDPAETGPILPPTSDLFHRIRNVSRTQCVRDLVLCGGK
jgi:hypothetical protein